MKQTNLACDKHLLLKNFNIVILGFIFLLLSCSNQKEESQNVKIEKEKKLNQVISVLRPQIKRLYNKIRDNRYKLDR